MADNKRNTIESHYIRTGDKIVPVTKEVYEAYWRPYWRDKKREERAGRCFIGNGRVLCRKDCSLCLAEKRSMLVSLEGMEEGSHFCVAGKETPDSIMERKEKIDLVRAGIARFDGRDRQILQMTMAGLTVRKIADVLGISPGLVFRRRNQIYAELRKYFREYGMEQA